MPWGNCPKRFDFYANNLIYCLLFVKKQKSYGNPLVTIKLLIDFQPALFSKSFEMLALWK
jgi:hypothetical protein